MGNKPRKKENEIIPKNDMRIFYHRVRALRAIGCWPMIDVKKSKFEIGYALICVLQCFNLSIGLVLTFYALVQFIISHGKVDQEMYNDIMLFVIVFQVLFKMVLVTSKVPKLRKLVEDLNEYMQDEFVVTEEDEKIINACFKYDNRLSSFFLTFSAMLAVSSVARPAVSTIKAGFKLRAAFANATEIPPLVGKLPAKYPFVLHAPSVPYVAWYLQQVVSVVPGAVASWAADSMFCSLLYYLCGHFDILINRIKSEVVDGFEKDARRQEIRCMRIVNHHRFLMRYCQDVINAFAPIMMMQMLLGAGTIGLLLMQLTTVDGDFLQYVKPASYLLLKLLQLYISCWHGQMISNKSEQVADACYFSPWYRKQRRAVLDFKMIIARSQKPIKVSAWGIFQFSARRFAGILNTAYSYFAMMRTMR